MSSSLEAKIVVLGSQGIFTSSQQRKTIKKGKGVGKTSLVHRYIQNTFNPTTTAPTLGASFITQRVLDSTSDTLVRLQIWDTAGQERFRSISRLYYRGAHACLLCYDITDEESFEEMRGWLRELKENIPDDYDDGDGDGMIIHVVGTKSDIVALDPSRRRVPFERTIAYVAEQLYPTQASTPPPTAAHPRSSSSTLLQQQQTPDSKRSSGFWGQEIGWDCCHEISAKDGEGIEEVFRVIARKLVEQRGRRELAVASSLLAPGTGMGTGSGGEGSAAASSSSLRVTTGHESGSLRLGAGTGTGGSRKSWLFSPSSVTLEEERVRKKRCC